MSDHVNRVKFTSTTTGTGSSIVASAAYSNAFLTPVEAGAVNGRPYTYVIQQGNDFEIQQDQTWTTSGTTIARGTPAFSKIGGVAGTTKINMDSTAVIAFGVSAYDLMFAQTRGADVAAAATLVLDTTTGKTVNLTGTTGISAVTLADGQERWAYYSGAGLTITVGSNLVGNGGGSNVVLATGDLVLFKGYASSVVRFTVFRLSGKPLVGPAAADISDSGAVGRAVLQSATAAAALTALGSIGSTNSASISSGSAVAFTGSGTVKNAASISVPAGTYLVFGTAGFSPGAATTATNLAAGISPTSATLPSPIQSGGFNQAIGSFPNALPFISTGVVVVTVATTTTYYLVGYAEYTGGAPSVYGTITWVKIA